jgi:SAM-dependent methyltransferase
LSATGENRKLSNGACGVNRPRAIRVMHKCFTATCLPMSSFADHFSRTAGEYASYRPRYPEPLFHWLAKQVPDRQRAWDCATGSGQAALALAPYFREVVASDPSVAQLVHAARAATVRYVAMTAERPALADGSISLVTVAQALHWFDRAAFFAEANRVLVPGGLLAVWRYGLVSMDDPQVDAIVGRFYSGTVGPYWPPERALVETGYAQLDFPFEELASPPFVMETQWSLAQLAGYISTWSAVGRYRAALEKDPLPALVRELEQVWPDAGESRIVRWPLEVRLGRRREPEGDGKSVRGG